jgi:CRP/FNR family cyclic AMP-dependent transcriptional regulator
MNIGDGGAGLRTFARPRPANRPSGPRGCCRWAASLPQTSIKPGWIIMIIDSDYLKDNEAIIRKLKTIPVLRVLEVRHLQKLLELSRLHEYPAGELILAEGSLDNRIYYLLQGKARIVKNNRELAVIRRTGDVFGEMGVIDGSARSASVYAMEPTVCLVADISSLDDLQDESKHVFRYTLFRGFAQILANRLRMTTEELMRAREEIAQLKNG